MRTASGSRWCYALTAAGDVGSTRPHAPAPDLPNHGAPVSGGRGSMERLSGCAALRRSQLLSASVSPPSYVSYVVCAHPAGSETRRAIAGSKRASKRTPKRASRSMERFSSTLRPDRLISRGSHDLPDAGREIDTFFSSEAGHQIDHRRSNNAALAPIPAIRLRIGHGWGSFGTIAVVL